MPVGQLYMYGYCKSSGHVLEQSMHASELLVCMLLHALAEVVGEANVLGQWTRSLLG